MSESPEKAKPVFASSTGSPVVTACPRCGQHYLVSCSHDGTEYKSVDMTAQHSLDLLKAYIEHLEEQTEWAKQYARKCQRLLANAGGQRP